MLQTYEATYRQGKLVWLDTPPDIEEARLLVTVLSGTMQTTTQTKKPPAKSLADAVNAAALLNPYRDLANPIDWQRDMRSDRTLPGRE